MEQVSVSIYWLPSEIREELDLPVAPEPYTNPREDTDDSMANYFGPMEPQPTAYKLQALTEANLEAHLQSQPPSFQDFAARCPPPSHKFKPDESQYSQYDDGVNGPTGFHWEVCSSGLTKSEFDEERPITTYEHEGMLKWQVTESVLTNPEPDIQKRAWDDGYENARKRFCDNDGYPIPIEQPVVDDLAELFPFGWELPAVQYSLPTCQTYWDDWQPEPGYEHYHYADVNFEDWELQPELPEVREPQQEVSPAHAWLLNHIIMPPTLFEPYYEEPQHLALTPMVEDTPHYVEEASYLMAPAPLTSTLRDAPECVESPLPMTPMFNDHPGYPLLTYQLPDVPYPAVNPGWTKPVGGRPTPPWRIQSDTEEGERIQAGLPLPPTRFLRTKALDLLNEFEEHPIPDIADLLPLKQKMRPVQEDILNWKFFSQRLPLLQRRNQQVKHLKLFWNSKATHDVHPHFHDTHAVRAC